MINSLTGLRAYAALLVFISHFYIFNYFVQLTQEPLRETLTQAGSLGVSLFFVLSGFVLTVNYLHPDKVFDVKGFYVARIARIYPVFLLTTLMAVPFVILSPMKKSLWGTLVPTLLMVHCFHPYSCAALNRVGWSISHEWFFYLLFPLFLAALVAKAPKRLGLYFVVFTVYLALMEIIVPHSYYATRSFPLNRVGEFLCGMAVGYLYLNSHNYPQLGQWFSNTRLRPVLLLALVSLFTLMVLEPVFCYRHFLLHQLNFVYYLLPATVLIFGIAMAEKYGNAFWFLVHPWVLLGGEISYSFYLLHHLVLRVVIHFFTRILHVDLQHGVHIGWGILLVITTFVITVAGSWWMYHTIEKPWRKRIVGFYRSKLQTSS